MADVLVRDVPEEVLAGIDAHAARLGLSRVEYIRLRLAATPPRQGTSPLRSTRGPHKSAALGPRPTGGPIQFRDSPVSVASESQRGLPVGLVRIGGLYRQQSLRVS